MIRRPRPGARIFLGALLVYLALLAPSNYSMDGNSMVAVAESIVVNHDFTVPSSLGKPGPDGRYYSAWYPLFSLTALPFVFAGRLAAPLAGISPHYAAVASVMAMQAVISALCCALVFLVALRLGAKVGAAFMAALGYAFGSVALVYSRNLYADPLLALIILAAVYYAMDEKPRPVALLLLACAAILAKPAGVVIGPVVVVYYITRKKPAFEMIAPAVGLVFGLILYGWYNFARFGDVLAFGSPWAFSFSAIITRLKGLLLSPGRGLFIYCPLVLAGVAVLVRRKSPETLLISLICLGSLFIHSLWTIWEGGWSWGPRLLLPVVPLLCACAALLDSRGLRFFMALAVLGFFVNLSPLFYTYERYYIESQDQGVSAQELVWSFKHTPFVFGWTSAAHQLADARGRDVRELVRTAGTDDRYGESFRIVPHWWWMLPAAGIPRWIGILTAVFMMIVGIFILKKNNID